MTPRRRVLSALTVASVALSGLAVATHAPLDWAFEVAPVPVSDAEPMFETVFDYTSQAGAAHAPAVRNFDDGFSLIWFDGTRESHEDVVIKESRFSKGADGWTHTDPLPLLSKEEMSAVSEPRQAILSLGNTIAQHSDPNTLFATVVSAGGWAAASIARVTVDGDTVTGTKKLSLSPFLNRSHLVRSPTLSYADGSVAIPAYFEMGNSFGELVRLDAEGHVRDKRRMTQGRFGIQPVIVPFDAQNAVALLRNFDKATDRLVGTWTNDGGRSWSKAELLDLPNPNSPVAALRLSDGRILMAFNDSPTNTTILKLALSSDQGRSWTRIHTLEQDNGSARYQMMTHLPDGTILLVYSIANKTAIRAHVFNESWVRAREEAVQ
ncbi:sialidase family protein [Shimia sp. SDUM112013]|uniref:sialidase family protein n=1 Tax=Shimia sp. SDUM112013 TaxID=3136160 RepID=UPI0032EBCC2F